MHITSTHKPGSDTIVGERSNFKKNPTITQDLSRRSISTSGESVSTYPRGPKAEEFINAVDVVVRLHDPTDPSTERTAPPCSAHVQLDDVPRAPIQLSVGDEFRQHDGVVTMMMFYQRRASPKLCDDLTEVEYGGGGAPHTAKERSIDQLVCLWGAPLPRI